MIIHKIGGGDMIKMDEVTKRKLTECLNWLSYTKELELEEARQNKLNN
tara:strand:+ start:17772 stop:17915 length:144 start_codon:yes stop_codon:yes gene_type:complete